MHRGGVRSDRKSGHSETCPRREKDLSYKGGVSLTSTELRHLKEEVSVDPGQTPFNSLGCRETSMGRFRESSELVN